MTQVNGSCEAFSLLTFFLRFFSFQGNGHCGELSPLLKHLLVDVPKVFKEAGTYRCKMKTYCRSLVLIHYRAQLFPSTDWENQEGHYREIKENVEGLLNDSKFHIGGKDDQVCGVSV